MVNSETLESLTAQDKGTALMAWYLDAITTFPDGLVTQSQAAAMLGINRVQIARLINRQHLRAVYFPPQTQAGAIKVSRDDPFWIKVIAQIDRIIGRTKDQTITWPEACYVAFKDVMRLHADNHIADKCRIDWCKAFPELAKKQKQAASNPYSKTKEADR